VKIVIRLRPLSGEVSPASFSMVPFSAPDQNAFTLAALDEDMFVLVVLFSSGIEPLGESCGLSSSRTNIAIDD
jgi:hypothetical protein